jgi:hypothetical protein
LAAVGVARVAAVVQNDNTPRLHAVDDAPINFLAAGALRVARINVADDGFAAALLDEIDDAFAKQAHRRPEQWRRSSRHLPNDLTGVANFMYDLFIPQKRQHAVTQRVIADFVHAAGNAARKHGMLPHVPANEKERGGNLMLVEKIKNLGGVMGMRTIIKRKGYDFFFSFNAPKNAARQSRAETLQGNGVTDVAFEGVPAFGVPRRQELESEICHAVIWHRNAKNAREIF